MEIWERAGLIGGTGFVGGNLMSQRPCARAYSSSTIPEIAGERFDTLICAGAPAVMWAANSDPEGDRANLHLLAERIASAQFDRLILISTIAVLDDMSAGHTEQDAEYERSQAYGRNRRELEQMLVEAHGATILRLPALFGEGLRKNYLYDLANPLPSFLKSDRFEELGERLDTASATALKRVYAPATHVDMMQLDRRLARESDLEKALVAALDQERAVAKYLTNSASTYQFYNLDYLADDIERAVSSSIGTLHVCSAPISAEEIHIAAFGEPFHNPGPAVVRQDMRTSHAAIWGSEGPYLYEREPLMTDISTFVRKLAA